MFNLFLCSQAYAFSLVGLLNSSLLTFNPSVFRGAAYSHCGILIPDLLSLLMVLV